MSPRNVGVLLHKELFQGPKNFFFIFAFVIPIILSLVISFIFGTLFADQVTLGIADEGSSQLVTLIEGSASVDSVNYDDVPRLKEAVAEGEVDGGIVLPPDFDVAVHQGERVDLPLYIWGESLAKNRTTLTVTITNSIRELSGQESPVRIETVTLGDRENIPWSDRLLPFIVLITVTIAGVALSGTSLLNEKEKKTIDALAVTPATVGEMFLAKGLLGVITGVLMGVVILAFNQALGAQPGLLVMMLFLGAVMFAGTGLLVGSLLKDLTSFFATMKVFGILLYAPAFFYMFPELPQWIAEIFPTYYIVEPIIEISQRGGGWPEIWIEVTILIGLDVLLIGLISLVVSRKKQYAV